MLATTLLLCTLATGAAYPGPPASPEADPDAAPAPAAIRSDAPEAAADAAPAPDSSEAAPAGAVSPPGAAEPAKAARLPRSGLFGIGVSLGPLAFGLNQIVGDGAVAVGPSFLAALQIDLSPRLALRLPLELNVGLAGPGSYADVGVTPGLLWRFRSSENQRLVPYLGAGFKLGVFAAHRGILGMPLVSSSPLTALASYDLDFDDDGDSDPDVEGTVGLFPELWLGADLQLGRLFAIELGGSYTYVRLLGRSLHVLHQRVGVRLAF